MTVTFEQALIELETVVKKIEEGRLPLEEAITSFERGVELRKFCEQKLSEAQLRVDKIQIASNGQTTIVPFEDSVA